MGGISHGAIGEKRADSLYIYCPTEMSLYTSYVFKTVNKIDYSNFETIHFIISIPEYKLDGRFSLGLFKGEYAYYTGAGGKQLSGVLADIVSYETTKCNKKEVTIVLPQNPTEELYAFLGGSGETGKLSVYEVWFE